MADLVLAAGFHINPLNAPHYAYLGNGLGVAAASFLSAGAVGHMLVDPMVDIDLADRMMVVGRVVVDIDLVVAVRKIVVDGQADYRHRKNPGVGFRHKEAVGRVVESCRRKVDVGRLHMELVVDLENRMIVVAAGEVARRMIVLARRIVVERKNFGSSLDVVAVNVVVEGLRYKMIAADRRLEVRSPSSLLDCSHAESIHNFHLRSAADRDYLQTSPQDFPSYHFDAAAAVEPRNNYLIVAANSVSCLPQVNFQREHLRCSQQCHRNRLR